MVELTGFEPVASSMPWKRATNCAIAPTSLRNGSEAYLVAAGKGNRRRPRTSVVPEAH